MNKIRLGLIGLGAVGQVHLQNCLKLPNAELVAVADVSKKALKRAQNMGVADVFEDYHKLVDYSNVDAVIIALPTHLHRECFIAASERHKHILIEKPLARHVNEGKDLLLSAQKHGIKVMVGYQLRFDNSFQELKSTIEKGELGEIQIAYATNIGNGPFFHRADTGAPTPVPQWWWNKDLTGGGALMDLGSHMIDLSRWFFGNVQSVKSYLGYRYKLDQEDHAICILKFESGQECIVTVGWFSQQTRIEVEVSGTAGHAITSHSPRNKFETGLRLMLRRPSGFQLAYIKEIQHFVDSLQRDENPSPSCEDALKDVEVIEHAYSNQFMMDTFT